MVAIGASRKRMMSSIACAVVVAGCASDHRQDRGTEPSANWPVIELRGPTWPRGTGWRLADQPLLTGGADEPSEDRSAVRQVSSALVLSDDDVVVSDRAKGLVQYLSLDATIRSKWGGLGAGHGEFSTFTDMQLFSAGSPGTVIVTDDGNQRIHIAGSGGSQIESIPLKGGGRVVGVFADGSWLVQFLSNPPSIDRQGPIDYGAHYWRYDARGRPVHKITAVTLPGRFVNGNDRVSDYLIPLTAQPSIAAVGEHLWVTSGSDPAVDAYTVEGKPAARYHWGLEKRFAEAQRPRIEKALARMPDPDRAVLQTLAAPRFLPTYEGMMADDAGNLWLRRYRLRSERSSSQSWDVVDPRQAWLGTVAIPPNLDVLAVSHDIVLGRVLDERTGTQRLYGYRILKAMSSSAREAPGRRGMVEPGPLERTQR